MAGQRCSPYLCSTSPRSPSGHLGAISNAPRGLQEPAKIVFIGPRGLQEPFKRLSAAITQISGNPMPFYIDFDFKKATPGPQKSMNYIEKLLFEEIAFSTRVASWTRCWTLLASLSGAFWPPRWLKPVLKFLLERLRAVQYYFFRPRERPKRRPRAPHKPVEGPL